MRTIVNKHPATLDPHVTPLCMQILVAVPIFVYFPNAPPRPPTISSSATAQLVLLSFPFLPFLCIYSMAKIAPFLSFPPVYLKSSSISQTCCKAFDVAGTTHGQTKRQKKSSGSARLGGRRHPQGYPQSPNYSICFLFITISEKQTICESGDIRGILGWCLCWLVRVRRRSSASISTTV